ncbi:complement decay-accelerating factor isoform X2 [Salarias fasciatus]|uniref:complement decay-accelerating factor isoform X2 n=1 Tax=Salarias fasciatus TaxID=181472 RepID=UPI001176E289|nr:complement decay-accelerating factor isoform X2 [Salarias fasciatus]
MEGSLEVCASRGARALLLFCLFVMRAAAECPTPQARESIVLTEESLLMNKFPEGTQATFECAHGHVKDSGSGIITCTNDMWTEPDLICKKKDCGPPIPQKNMHFNASGGTLFGAIATVYCDKGYQITGMSYKQCFATGWIGRAKCEIITCEEPPKVANGRSSWDVQDDPKYGETIEYTCDKGYTLIGADSIMCGESGEFDPQPPECRGLTTEDPLLQTPTFPAQAWSATPTAHRDKTVTLTAASAASPSEREFGRDIFRTEGKAATTTVTSTTPPSLQGKPNKTEVTNSDVDYIPVIVSVICVSLVGCIVAFLLHKYLLRRKGSYDTREDLKPELLQFQNL